MEYGQIAGNKSINSMIYLCFDYIVKADRFKFLKKFQQQVNDSNQVMHTFRELVLGAYLSSRGFHVRHDFVINDQTPDWSILDASGELVTSIVELMSFHLDRVTEKEIDEQFRINGLATYWRDRNKDNVNRLYQSIWHKASKYKSLVNDLGIPYIVGVFPQFEATVDLEELHLCLLDEETGLFHMFPEISGVIFFEEISGRYVFNFLKSNNAIRDFGLRSSYFPKGAT